MPSRQQERDRRAQELGFRNYLDYRNHLARQEGYRNYYDQRKARQSGRGLRGRDRTRAVSALSLPPGQPSRDLAIFRRFQSLTSRFSMTGADLRSIQRGLLDRSLNNDLFSDTVRRASRDITEKIQSDVLQFSKEFPDVLSSLYRTGYRLGLEDDSADLPVEASDRIRKLHQQTMEDIKRAALGVDRSSKSFLPRIMDVQSRREGLGLIRRHGIRAVVYSNGARRSYEDFVVSSMRASALRAANEGFLVGASARGVTTFKILDGEDCGLTSHRDGQRANGMVVDLETAMAYPLSHPNCVRQFVASPGEQPEGTKESFARKVARTASATAKASLKASAQATLLETARTFALQRGLDQRLAEFSKRAVPAARAYAQRLRTVSFSNVVDLKSGKPVKFRVEDIATDITTYADDFAAGRPIPAHVRMVLGVDATSPRKVVGDAFDSFHDYYDNALRADMSVSGGRVLENLINDGFRDGMFGTFYDLVQDRSAGRFVRFSAPRLDGSKRNLFGKTVGTRRPRITADLFKLVRGTTTFGKSGNINNLTMNPNGLVRAGFTRDAIGAITPSFRFVPPGPVRISTRVNRSKTGAVTSLSVDLRVITPKSMLRRANEWTGLTDNGEVTSFLGRLGVTLGMSLNVNLRQLGLQKLSDITRLSVDDWKKLRQETYYNPVTEREETHPVVQVISLAAQFRLGGGSLFDLSKTLRIKWEDAVKIWQLTSLEIRTLDKTNDYLAQRRRRRIYLMRGVGNG